MAPQAIEKTLSATQKGASPSRNSRQRFGSRERDNGSDSRADRSLSCPRKRAPGRRRRRLGMGSKAMAVERAAAIWTRAFAGAPMAERSIRRPDSPDWEPRERRNSQAGLAAPLGGTAQTQLNLVLRRREAASKDDSSAPYGKGGGCFGASWSILRGSCCARAPQDEGGGLSTRLRGSCCARAPQDEGGGLSTRLSRGRPGSRPNDAFWRLKP
jgi:hypothetical protein